MVQQEIHLRAGEPTEQDGLCFARYLDQAAEGFFRIMLGPRMAAIVAEAYTQRGHDLSYEHATFAEHAGDVVGMAAAFTAEQRCGFSEEPLRRAAGPWAWRYYLFGVLGAPVWNRLKILPEGDHYLLAIAVDGNFRGAGIGSILIDDVEARARAAGSKRLVLDVSAKNTGGRKLYERRGMAVESTWPRTRLIRPVLLRMVKGL